MARRDLRKLWVLFFLALSVNIFLWTGVRDRKPLWLNVPSVPSAALATAFSLGDTQFAYRTTGLMLQNLGETGGRSLPLTDYDYKELVRWFFLEDTLDPQAQFVPLLAAFYFGAVPDPDRLRLLLPYLRTVGQRPGGERWRWLAHAAYLAHSEIKDPVESLALARTLAALNEEGLPLWTKQMPAFILASHGDRAEALSIMLEILKATAEGTHPNEVNFMRDYICNRLLNETERGQNPICGKDF
ncbi:MAG: hypothetical protein K9G62_08840 [Alphaproteobacteria bacterium]|nr:hypothetical protein [Alphaproteobacteria bacterium]